MTVLLPPPPRLFLVDGYALIYRAFFALISRPLTTSHGENTSAAWGVVNFVQRLLNEHRPEYVGWVHDSGTSFRKERYPAYKATREKLSEELQSDFDRGMERIRQLLEAYRVPVITLPGYEADDVIGSLALRAVEAGINTVVVSGDKDFQQLVRPGVWLLNPGRGGAANIEEHWVGVENGAERLGVPPALVVDYLALVGDSSDNIPGVRGIGDKTAAELVNSYGTVENILAHASELTKKRPREALLEQRESALLSKELVTIRADLPVRLDLDAMRLPPPDRERLRTLFVELEFHTLAKAIEDQPTSVEAATPAPANYATLTSAQDVEAFVKRARLAPYVAIELETVRTTDVPTETVGPLRSTLVGITMAVGKGEAAYIPLAHRARHAAAFALEMQSDAPAPKSKTRKTTDPVSIAAKALAERASPVSNAPSMDDATMAPLKALLEDASVRKVAHDAKFAMLALRQLGITIRGLDFDTMIASYLLDPGRRSHGLELLALEFLNRKMTNLEDLCGKGREAIPFNEVPVDCARDFACAEADIAWQLRAAFEPQLESLHLTALLRDVEMPLVSVLAEVEWQGVLIDLPWFAQLKERFARERERVEREIYEAAGGPFNINSNPQLREILFDKLHLPVLKRTSTGPSTDATVLQQLADDGHTLPVLLMEYRELSKLEGTYVDALPAVVDRRTGRIHTSFSQTVAATGRLSSSDPNLQNIPIRRELGRDIRRGFIARSGWRLMAADYSQIELRLLAHLSDDPAFVEAFHSGGDIHRQTAAIIFGTTPDAVTPEMRAQAKTINFATIYGQGPHALSQQLKISHADAKEFIRLYFERFVGVRGYLDSMVAFAREHGYVQTIFARRRYIPELRDRNFNIRSFGERTAANSPIQGSAADLIKIAMIRIDAAIRAEKLSAVMLLQVHDELVFETPIGETEPLSVLVRREMEHAAELKVPLVVDIGTGENWLNTKMD